MVQPMADDATRLPDRNPDRGSAPINFEPPPRSAWTLSSSTPSASSWAFRCAWIWFASWKMASASW